MGQPLFVSISVMSGPRDGDVLRFVPNPENDYLELNIGRRDNSEVPLAYDSQVSRQHARLIYDGEQFWLEDLDSRNGTFIGQRIVKKRVKITPGTLFRVGRTWLRLDPLPPEETQSLLPFMDSDLPF